MWFLILLLITAMSTIIGVVIVVRWSDARAWRRSLVAYEVHAPSRLTADDLSAWLSAIAALTHPPKASLLPLPPVAFEVSATSRGVRYYLLIPEQAATSILGALRVALPGCRVNQAAEYLQHTPPFMVAAESRLTNFRRPLAVDRAESASAQLVTALHPIPTGCEIRMQWILTSAGTPVPVATAPQHTQDDRLASYLIERESPADAEAVRAARLKQREPLLRGSLRVGVAASSKPQAFALLARSWRPLHGMNAPGVRVVRRWLPSSLISARLRARSYPLLLWPMVMNSRELAGLFGLPLGGVRLPGVSLTPARQLPPAPSMPRIGAVVATSNYPGMDGQPLALRATDRLMHLHLVGPTGTGKSTLIVRLALQDIAAGYSVVVVDPKGDMIEEIAARIPEDRRDDVIVLDPSMTDMPIGFNPLAVPGGQAARELAADQVLGIFHSIYRDFWGPRTDDILRAALLSLTHTHAVDGSAFTLVEVPELLTNPRLRRIVSAQPSLPEHLRLYWQHFEALSDGERTQAIGPVLNKLRAFTMRTPVRLMLGQSQGIKLDARFCQRGGVLLVSLAKGKLGGETASLIGSLLVASLWQAVLQRVDTAPDKRRPMYTYLDEFQDIVRLGSGESLADMLAQARGLGMSLTLAHQYMSQLSQTVREAVLGTTRTQLAFQCEYDDARLLAPRFAPLTADDLMGLAAYEIALRPCVDKRTLAPVTGTTLALEPATGDAGELAASSRARHGRARADVEAALRRRIEDAQQVPGLGRVARRTS